MVKITARTLLIAAGLSLVPDVSVAGANLRFIDFQNSCIDLLRSTLSTDTPQAATIGTFPCASRSTTAQWTTTLTGLTNFNITSTISPTFVLSVGAVGNTIPTTDQPLVDQIVIGRVGSAMSWKFVANSNFPGKHNIVPSFSPGGVTSALRSYPKRYATATNTDATYSPLMLDTLNVNDPQQAFTIQNV